MLNQTDDRPDETLAKSIRDHFLAFKESFFEPSKQQDSIVVWLVGMSTGIQFTLKEWSINSRQAT